MLVVFVVVAVTLAWVAALGVAAFTGNYNALVVSTPLAGACVGYVTGMRIWRNGEGK